MTRTDLLLTPDNEHDKESNDVPITGFCGAKFKGYPRESKNTWN